MQKKSLIFISAIAFLWLAVFGLATFGADKPRTLDGYLEQEHPFYNLLKKIHPLFASYEKEGRFVGQYRLSDRDEEFIEFGGGMDYAESFNRQVSITYRLGAQSLLDLPNQFVGSKKCGECHPVQYEKWLRSRHNLTVRFPDEITEVEDLMKPVYKNSPATILPQGITPDSVFAIIGTPRTKYGFLDPWLVRGTYHIEGGTLKDQTGTLVPGGNQFSRSWAESITPEVAQKIAKWIPGFPTKLQDFGDNGSDQWGMTSYGSRNKKTMLFQPATAYCEICHTFKFDFKSQDELYKALGNPAELRKHTINKGVSCEECHGAGAHLQGARGTQFSNCERCHQRFAWNADEARANPKRAFSAYFKTQCPACGTEGAQSYYTAHGDKGMTCTTCHDPHEVTANDWRDPYTIPALKKKCEDCHKKQAAFTSKSDVHSSNKCSSCHMPTMMSCENFAAIQYSDYAGFDAQRTSHIWKIKVHPTKKTLNPPPGKPRDWKGPWRLAKEKGKPFVDLMWSCGRTSWGDDDLVTGAGCHSPVMSKLPDELHFKNQKQIYDQVVFWQTPVKKGLAEVKKTLITVNRGLAAGKGPLPHMSQAQLMVNQAQDILEAINDDGSWGVHAPTYTMEKLRQAKLLAEGALYLTSSEMTKSK